MVLNKRYDLAFALLSKHLNNVEFKMIHCKKTYVVIDCDYSTIVDNLWNTQISDEVELDESIKNNVVIGQLEQGITNVQSSCTFHTLAEACGYQHRNGGTLNIITRPSEITTVEIVESYPKGRSKELVEMYSYGIRDDLTTYKSYDTGDEVCIKRIYGPKKITGEEIKVISEIAKCDKWIDLEKAKEEDATIQKMEKRNTYNMGQLKTRKGSQCLIITIKQNGSNNVFLIITNK